VIAFRDGIVRNDRPRTSARKVSGLGRWYETPHWPLAKGRYGLHHGIVHGDTAYCSWRDGCLVVVDVSDRTAPKLITHKVWAPPYGGGTHNALPLPDRNLLVVVDEAVLDNQEDGLKLIWVFDNRQADNPISISTFPTPADADYKPSEDISGRTTFMRIDRERSSARI
jgi:hypothetical protein